MAGIFFTADTHFGHASVIGTSRRRRADGTALGSVAAMDAMLVEAWNAVVGPGDTVWHLGDFARARGAEEVERARAVRRRLNGRRVFLVRGNHDDHVQGPEFGWAGVFETAEVEAGTVRLVLGHAAMADWPGAREDVAWHLHGHSHGRMRDTRRRMDVGVDAVARWAGAMRPVALEEVTARMAALPEDEDAAGRRQRPR